MYNSEKLKVWKLDLKTNKSITVVLSFYVSV